MLTFTDNPVTKLVPNLSFGDYCTRPGINQSAIKLFDYDSGGCPALYRYAAQYGDPRPDSAAKRDGRAYHHYLLQRDTFEERYAILTKELEDQLFDEAVTLDKSKAKGFSTKLSCYMRWKVGCEAEGREVISQAQVDEFERMAEAISESSDVSEELGKLKVESRNEKTGFELSAFAGSKIPPVQLKARFDLVPPGDALIDLKSARSAHPAEFAKVVARLGLDIQCAFYIDVARLGGLDKRRFGFLTQDKFPPYLSCIHWMPEAWIKYGRIRYRKILLDIADAFKRNDWPGYRSGELMPPSWLMTEIEAIAA